MTTIVNTRADLDALKGTSAYRGVMDRLKESMTTRVNAAIYPEGYGRPGYEGPEVAPVWEDLDTPESVERLGFTAEEFLAEYALLSPT